MSVAATIVIGSNIKQSDSILVQSLDDDIVMANIDSGHYFGVDQTSKRIWELLEKPVTVADLCTRIVKEYDVEPAKCEQDVLSFVNELAREGLIQVVV